MYQSTTHLAAQGGFPDASLTEFRPGKVAQADFLLNIITTTDPRGGQILPFLSRLEAEASTLDACVFVTVVDDLSLWKAELPAFAYDHICVRVLSYVPVLTQQRAIAFASLASPPGAADLLMDPDMHPALGSLPRVVESLRNGALLVHCERPTRHGASRFRRVASGIYGFLFNLLSGCRIRDPNSPMVACGSGLLRSAVSSDNESARTYPRIHLYCQYRSGITRLPLGVGDVPHPSHYRLAQLLPIFWGQLTTVVKARFRLAAISRKVD